MPSLKPVCVVVPIHSSEPTPNELISFQQCFKILGSHPIFIVAPMGLSLEKYRSVINDFETFFIDVKWQSSISKYNELKYSAFFFTLFEDYEHLLTYELDAFVFKDELRSWCEKGYDYIGAPWFEGYHNASEASEISGVGNSGFSLRNIQRCIEITTRIKTIKSVYDFLTSIFSSNNVAKKNIKRLLKIYFKLHYGSSSDFVFQNICINEDYYWCILVPSSFVFKIAPIDEAIKFSFEVNSSLLYKINNENLPFGCHAWSKYEPNFWCSHINY